MDDLTGVQWPMATQINHQEVRDSDGNTRILLVSTYSAPGMPDAVEYRLESALVEKQTDGTFKAKGTGEVYIAVGQ